MVVGEDIICLQQGKNHKAEFIKNDSLNALIWRSNTTWGIRENFDQDAFSIYQFEYSFLALNNVQVNG